jgi:zinc transport system ATP-binding protein
MSDLLLTLTDIGLKRDGRDILKRINLTVERGEIVTLIGPNGAGKWVC